MTVSNQKKHLCPCETKGTMQKMGSKMTCALFFLLKAFWKNQGHGKGHLNMLSPIDYNRFPLLWVRNSYFSNVGTFPSLLPLPGGRGERAPSDISKEKYNGSSTL